MSTLVVVPDDGSPPRKALTGAASRLTNETVKRIGSSRSNEKGTEWQNDAIDLTNLVGEQQFIVNTLANRVSAARFYAGKINEDDITAKPEVLDNDHKASKVLDAFGDTPSARAQIIGRASINLSVPGKVYLVGIPADKLKDDDKPKGLSPTQVIQPDGGVRDDSIDIEDLKWFALSVREVTKGEGKKYKFKIDKKDYEFDPDEIWLMAVWDPDPQHADRPTSPTRAVLPILRELTGLTMHVSAQIDSRLAGAGLFLIAQEADQAVRNSMGPDYDGEDPIGDQLMEAGTTAIADRANASALFPVTTIVPQSTIQEGFRFISFATPLDKEARFLREEAIRRLALGQNVPPEVLLGVGGMNHWGAWLVREDTISTHVEPQLALICDALTTEYLWPVLKQQGMSEKEYQQYVIWYDVDHLISRPNRLEDAIALHKEGVISDQALRDAGGFIDEDAQVAPSANDEASAIVLKMVQQQPGLIRNPGTDELVESIRKLLKGESDPGGAPLPEEVSQAEPDETAVEVREESGFPSDTPL